MSSFAAVSPGPLLNSGTEVAHFPLLRSRNQGFTVESSHCKGWSQNASLLDLVEALCLQQTPTDPGLGSRCRLAPHQLQPLPAPLRLGSRGALPGVLRHPQGDGGWKLVPLNFARELYLATERRPGVGSLSIDSNQQTILELPENPQHGIYRSLWASGREAITLACLGLQERGLFTGSGAGSWAPERLGVPLTPVPGPEPRGQALASQSEGSARGFLSAACHVPPGSAFRVVLTPPRPRLVLRFSSRILAISQAPAFAQTELGRL